MYIPVHHLDWAGSLGSMTMGMTLGSITSGRTVATSLSPSSRKRKRDGEGEQTQTQTEKLASFNIAPTHTGPSQISKLNTVAPPRPTLYTISQAQASPRKRPRRLRSPHSHSATGSSPKQQHKSTSAPAVLGSCHVCHRRPTTKMQLSSYADCEACGERTCYICLRECEGPCGRGSETGRKICSGCCVEQGGEGTVTCLECLEERVSEGIVWR